MGSINLKWRDAMAVAGWHFKLAEHDAGWPQSMKPDQVAALQRPYVRGGLEHRPGRWRTEALMKSITDACKSGELIHTAVTEIVTPKPPPVQHRNEFASSDWLGEFGRFGLTGVRNGRITSQPSPQPRDVTTYTVTAPAFAAWLTAQREEPSPHIQAWFDTVGVTAGAVVPAAPVAVSDSTATTPQAPAKRIKRRDLLTPLIEAAQSETSDQFDTPAIWAKLCDMAERKIKPLFGVAPEGIQWTDENDEPQFFSLRALRDRLGRQKKTAQKSVKTPLVRVK